MLFVASSPPLWVLGAGAGAGAAVPAVAVAGRLVAARPSWRNRRATGRWLAYLVAGLAAAATIGPWLVLVLLGCGAIELAARSSSFAPRQAGRRAGGRTALARLAGRSRLVLAAGGGVLASVAWEAFKVGGLSFGGGFVIIPLMQADAVSHYHWMTGAQFLNAVALGQVTPGPVVQTVAVVGYAAAGHRRRPARLRRRLRPVVPARPARRAALPADPRQRRAPAPSSTAPGPPPSAPSSAPPSPSPGS